MPLTDNLSSHWRLDETTAVSAADAHGSNTLSQTGGSVGVTSLGKIGWARTFSGLAEHLEIASTSTLEPASVGGMSVAGWFRLDDFSQSPRYLFHKGMLPVHPVHAVPFEYGLSLIGIETPYLSWTFYFLGGILSVSWPDPIPLNEWVFVVCRCDPASGTAGISVNGAEFVEDTDAPWTFSSQGQTFRLGHGSLGTMSNTGPFSGRMDSWSFWRGRQITRSEAAELYASGNGLDYPFSSSPSSSSGTTTLFVSGTNETPSVQGTIPLTTTGSDTCPEATVPLVVPALDAISGNLPLTTTSVDLVFGDLTLVAEGSEISPTGTLDLSVLAAEVLAGTLDLSLPEVFAEEGPVSITLAVPAASEELSGTLDLSLPATSDSAGPADTPLTTAGHDTIGEGRCLNLSVTGWYEGGYAELELFLKTDGELLGGQADSRTMNLYLQTDTGGVLELFLAGPGETGPPGTVPLFVESREEVSASVELVVPSTVGGRTGTVRLYTHGW